jgi:hypothetical protein
MTKCALCDTKAAYKLNNPGAEVQLYCVEHLPWFINRRVLPAHVEVLNEPKPDQKEQNESRKNSNKASSSSSGSSNPTEGTVSSGSSSGTSDTEGLPAAE